MVTVKRKYTSNVTGLQRDIDRKLLRIVERAARDGAQVVRQRLTRVSPRVGDAKLTSAGPNFRAGVISCPVTVPANQFWAVMQDKGTLGKRKLPLKYPNKRKSTWHGQRRGARPATTTAGGYRVTDTVSTRRPGGGGTDVTFHRTAEALDSGGMRPRYAYIRGQRQAERSLARYLIRGV